MSKALFTAMSKAFPEIEGAVKDCNNPHFKSKYADLSSVVEAIKPALIKNGLFFSQVNHEQTGGVCVETIVCHEDGDQMSFGKLFVPASKQDAQGYGSALTYARRYSLMTAFGVCPEDDDGNAASRTAPRSRPANEDDGAPPVGDEPAAREKLVGKHASKSALKAALKGIFEKVRKAQSVRELDAIEQEFGEDLRQCERYLPLWWKGDDANGSKGWLGTIQARRGVLGLIESVTACETRPAMQAWLASGGDQVDALDDVGRREWEAAWSAREAEIEAMDRTAA